MLVPHLSGELHLSGQKPPHNKQGCVTSAWSAVTSPLDSSNEWHQQKPKSTPAADSGRTALWTGDIGVQGLLRELLQLVGDRAEARKAVLGVYGEVLSQRNMQEDSALAFTAAQDLPRALQAYKVAGHWQMALTLAGQTLHLLDACSLLCLVQSVQRRLFWPSALRPACTSLQLMSITSG